MEPSLKHYPMQLKPVYKDYLWGGDRLKTLFHKQSDLPVLAESWELCSHSAGSSIVLNGSYTGQALPDIIAKDQDNMLGEACKKFDRLPLMLKLIDAKKNLSIQVHPDDEYAQKAEGEYGKTEMWYILDALPDAFLYFGFQHDITKEQYRASIADGSVTELLNKVYVSRGDLLFIKAGTVHAIGEGILLAEIQQNSNTTYRVFDFNRTDKDGNKRELHIEKAVDVSNLKKQDFNGNSKQIVESTIEHTVTALPACPYFASFIFDIKISISRSVTARAFQHLLCIDGGGHFIFGDQALPLSKGDSIFLPANLGEYSIVGTCQVLMTTIL